MIPSIFQDKLYTFGDIWLAIAMWNCFGVSAYYLCYGIIASVSLKLSTIDKFNIPFLPQVLRTFQSGNNSSSPNSGRSSLRGSNLVEVSIVDHEPLFTSFPPNNNSSNNNNNSNNNSNNQHKREASVENLQELQSPIGSPSIVLSKVIFFYD